MLSQEVMDSIAMTDVTTHTQTPAKKREAEILDEIKENLAPVTQITPAPPTMRRTRKMITVRPIHEPRTL